MTMVPRTDWLTEFGIEDRSPPGLFTRKEELTPSTPQAHLLRRAFDTLKIDGVLCADHSPLAYFKLVKRITPDVAFGMHRRFWNHGGAALLVLITDTQVHVYSGMTRPAPATDGRDEIPSFVQHWNGSPPPSKRSSSLSRPVSFFALIGDRSTRTSGSNATC